VITSKKTLVIAKIKISEQIIGGYNPLDWNGREWKCTNQSFIFDRNYVDTGQFSYVVESWKYNYAISCNPHSLPYFGKNILFQMVKYIVIVIQEYIMTS
jgi:hypothetical protein